MMNSSRNRRFDESHLESMNDSLAEGLSSKVGQLKSLAIDLDNESRDHLPLLDGMDDEMDGGSGRLGGTMGRLRGMARSSGLSGRRLTCTVAALIFTLFVFFFYFVLPMATKA